MSRIIIPNGGSSSGNEFILLSDTPNSYSNSKGKKLAVNEGETGLEFEYNRHSVNIILPDLSDSNQSIKFNIPNHVASIDAIIVSLDSPDSVEIDIKYGDTPSNITNTIDNVVISNSDYYKNINLSAILPAYSWVSVDVVKIASSKIKATVVVQYTEL